MPQVAIIGVDLAKRVFQLHGAAADGSVLFRKKLTRVRIPMMSATLSNRKPATDSDLKPAGIPI